MNKDINDFIFNDRNEFLKGILNKDELDINPISQLRKWLNEAVEKFCIEPYAFQLATVDQYYTPSIRTLYLRSIESNGIIFFTNYTSKKSKEIDKNSITCANFFWPQLERQVRITGKVSKINSEISDAYFESRPRKSQIGAWASSQSEEINKYEDLINKVEYFTKKFENRIVPRPDFWGGYILEPTEIEFWQGRANRLHNRYLYKLANDNWKITLLNP